MQRKTKPSYLVQISNFMAQGLFASLIVGLILEQIGHLLGSDMVVQFGQIAKLLMGPAIGVAVATGLQSPPLVIFASAVSGAIGAGSISFTSAGATLAIGEPVGAMLAALAGAEVGRFLAGKTKVDIVILPSAVILVGGAVGLLVGPPVALLMAAIGEFINVTTQLHPIPMGIIVSVVMGIVLTLPISSAAVAISLGLKGLAAGAATVGCSVQMVGFAVASFRENGWGGLLAQGLGTSMLQMPNIIRNPRVWIPPIVVSALLGPLATQVFRMENIPAGAGMGTSGLVGQIGTLSVMGSEALPAIILLHFVLPAIGCYLLTAYLRRIGWIKDGDLRLDI
ncbi:MAG: PTS transporter subunit IIC [Limnochordia bacterium]